MGGIKKMSGFYTAQLRRIKTAHIIPESMQAGDAGPGLRLRRRRREVALEVSIARRRIATGCLPYDHPAGTLRYPISGRNENESGRDAWGWSRLQVASLIRFAEFRLSRQPDRFAFEPVRSFFHKSRGNPKNFFLDSTVYPDSAEGTS
jgi:hypothetical protein